MALVIAIALGTWMASAYTRPLRALTQAAHALPQGGLGRQLPVRAPAELGRLTQAFNRMSLELARLGALRRQMTADMQAIVTDVKEHRKSLIRVLEASDSLLTRVQEGRGTLSLLASDSVLYHEATGAVKQLRQLLADIQANPRKYFRFSVF